MDVSGGEHRSFVHRVLRWIALLAIAFGTLNVASFVVFGAFEGFSNGSPFFGGRSIGLAYYAMLLCSTAIEILGGCGLAKGKSWGRTLLILWSVIAVLIGFVMMVFSAMYYSRQYAQTSQPSYQPNVGLMVWNSFYYWVHNSGLPILFLAVLLQPEVKRLWSGSRTTGFDVIPMARTVGDEQGE